MRRPGPAAPDDVTKPLGAEICFLFLFLLFVFYRDYCRHPFSPTGWVIDGGIITDSQIKNQTKSEHASERCFQALEVAN